MDSSTAYAATWFGTGTGVGAALIIEKPWVAAGTAVLGGIIGHFCTYYSRRKERKNENRSGR